MTEKRQLSEETGDASGAEPNVTDQGVCPDPLENYEQVEDKICYLLVNAERNAVVLKDVPWGRSPQAFSGCGERKRRTCGKRVREDWH